VVEMSENQTSGFGRARAFEDRMRSMRRWRLAINSAGLAFGVILVATGNTLIGLVIGGLAAARLVMFTRFSVPERRSRTSMTTQNRGWLRAQARDEVLVAAGVIGCPPAEMRARFQQGSTIADVAAERSVSLDHVTTAIAADLTAKAHAAEVTGALSHDDAERVQKLAPRFADRLVHGHRGDFRGAN
jgi:hypothetical protein